MFKKGINLLTILTLFLSVIFTPATHASIFKTKQKYPKTEEYDKKIVIFEPLKSFPLGKSVILEITSVLYRWERGNLENPENYYLTRDSNDWLYHLRATGVSLRFKNISGNVVRVLWRDSSISVGEYSGLPFLSGMKYSEANTLVTPDTLIAPGQTISKDVFLPIVNFGYDRYNGSEYGHVVGIVIPRGNPVQIILTLLVADNKTGTSDYYTIKCPPIGVEE